MKTYRWILFVLMLVSVTGTAAATPAQQPAEAFSFAVAADMRNFAGSGTFDTAQYFRGAMAAIEAQGPTAFLVVPGDLDPPEGVDWTVVQVMGAAYPWFPVIGNHEAETPADMTWLRSYDYSTGGAFTLNSGPTGCPQTTYSFDYANAHFVVLNQYCNVGGDTVTDGDVPDHLYHWLAADLAATDQPHAFVFGHEPAYPQPDADNGRVRHVGDSLDAHPANRERFWSLLASENVTAYITGHTHNYSAVKIAGVWQIDAGHARGLGDPGALSTFVLVHVDGERVSFDAFRGNADSTQYTRRDGGLLAGFPAGMPVFLPLIER